MRSKLFVPGSRPELFAKAAASAADALSFDLEDAVAPGRKAEARAALSHFLQDGAVAPGKLIVVRVNAVGTPHFADDMAAVATPRLDLINLPMVEDAAAVTQAAALLDRIDPAQRIRLLVNIETPMGLRKAAELAAAHPRVAGLQIGYADLFEPTGIDRHDPAALAHIRIAIRLAAAEAGVAAYDGAYAVVKNPDGYREECEAARRHGFAGKSCIHPTQIAIANAAFMPTAPEIERARRIIAAAHDAEAKGIGAYLVDGQMIDAPFLASARAVVALAESLGVGA
ncbi:CoA ester lyase [Acidisphaera sp. L21]|uniref:HpcH/HpaI aldolase/citrate lyase family protein n=1 Tax=Acidisphaera sp. L21 TaxID=1641851 RepID=UPI00131D50D1|nr:CoA ester lyase [Acidisphaera sp. L21]